MSNFAVIHSDFYGLDLNIAQAKTAVRMYLDYCNQIQEEPENIPSDERDLETWLILNPGILDRILLYAIENGYQL